jgi:predicted dehydrogenase
MENFTWGIIGPGNIAKEFAHDLAMVKSACHRVGAVLSHEMQKAEVFAEEEHAHQAFDDLESFIQDAEVDAVYIATPHSLHCEEAIQCLRNNIPVLCEKPLAINTAQVQEMIDASEQHNTFLMEGMWIRFLPSIQKVLSLIEGNVIGNIISIQADMSYVAPREQGSRYFDPKLGGGSLLDLGIYPVYLSHLLLGRPDKIQAWARLTKDQIDEGCAALLHYRNGVNAIIQSSLVMKTPLQAVIYGDKGKITILENWNEKPKGIIVELHNGQKTVFACNWEGRGFQYEIEEVYYCIRAGQTECKYFCHHFSLDLMMTMDEIRKQTGIEYPYD